MMNLSCQHIRYILSNVFLFLVFLTLNILVKGQYFSGYGKEIKGETLKYESQQPDANESLLVRSMNRNKYIEWYTEPVPEDYTEDFARFILLTGIDVNAEDNHQFNLFINDKLTFSFRNPIDTLTKNWEWESESGITWKNKGVMIDKYQDLFSYVFLQIPKKIYTPGSPVKIRVEGESADSRSWFMVFKYSAVQSVKLLNEQAILRGGAQAGKQLVRVDILHFDDPATANISIGKSKSTHLLELGYNMMRIAVPLVERSSGIEVTVRVNDTDIYSSMFTIQPVVQKTIYLLPHSHIDIGYTHIQEEVEKIQWQNIRDAVTYAKKTKNYPVGARFKWCGEVMWAVESYLQNCSEQERKEFIEAVQQGLFEPNALFANILTGLCRPEELYQMLQSANKLEKVCNVDIQSAMISDIPGYSWSIVPVMAQNGVNYFSIGTNTFHRIGNIIDVWGDKPFYWESFSGMEKILCWVHGKGYSEFHTGLAYTKLRNKLKEQVIFDYVRELYEKDYPYDIITMRYNIGSDNGPPDPYLSDIVKNWNEKYVSPRLEISTVTESFSAFEELYGDVLPVYRGDLTGYWEDGAASSAYETSVNRMAAEKLSQASVLYSLYNPGSYPGWKFSDAWQKILLYSEHTWGSWNSISEPFSEFTIQQWNTKRSFAIDALKMAEDLIDSAIPKALTETVYQVTVYNTSSWKRTDLVRLKAEYFLKGDRVTNENGKTIPTQRLSNGELVFVAEDIPPFGSKTYFFENEKNLERKGDETNDNFHLFKKTKVDIHPQKGTITNLLVSGNSENLVSTDIYSGLNTFYYVSGRDPKTRLGAEVVNTKVIEKGPVLKTFQINFKAPGCNNLTSEVTIFKDLGHVVIENNMHKKDILEQEAVHFVFPFNLENGIIRVSNAWDYYQPGKGQLPAANKNFFSVNRWADISNTSSGVTFVSVDAPLIEINAFTCDPIEVGWNDTVAPGQTIISYVMNNYWETNYKASQPGEARFRYALYPHGEFDPVQSARWGIEQHQPLIPVVSDRLTEKKEPSFTLNNPSVIVESIQPIKTGILLRIFNPSVADEIVSFVMDEPEKKIYLCRPSGEKVEELNRELEIRSGEVLNLLIQ